MSPSHILKDLPSEVRIHIWSYVLGSSSGYIMLRRSTHTTLNEFRIFEVSENYSNDDKNVSAVIHGVIGLSFLRTCKQIRAETQGMFWRLNTLVLTPGEFVLGSRCLDFNQIVNVRFDIEVRELWERSDLKRTEKTLKLCGKWARDGQLRNITINPTPGLLNIMDIVQFREVGSDSLLPEDYESVFQAYLTILRKAGDDQGYLVDVNRIVVINTGWNDLTADMQRHKSDEYSSSGNSIRLHNLLKDIHGAFGGELWQDQTLCYQRDIEIAAPFKVKSPNAEKEMHP